MTLQHLPAWHGDFATHSPLFNPLGPLLDGFNKNTEWPTLLDYQEFLQNWSTPILTTSGKPLTIVAQAGRPKSFEQHYAPRIYTYGEIQTREENWHDFFQYLTWFMFPKTKACINSIHIPHARERIAAGQALGRRTPIENTLSLFDEGGAVLVASDDGLLDMVREFRWKELFWENRVQLSKHFECITFGHAMYEKGLVPYVGMTANTILLRCPVDFHGWSWVEKWQWLDEKLLEVFSDGSVLQKPKDLQPFPILGMPGWDEDNHDKAYYDNTRYFRMGRCSKGCRKD